MSGPERVLAALRGGPLTTNDLCLQTGLTRDQVWREIWRLRERGVAVLNLTPHRHDEGVWTLGFGGDAVGAPAMRHCRFVGCDTILSRYNATDYCSVHRQHWVKCVVAGWTFLLSRLDSMESGAPDRGQTRLTI
jgi:hypothetical protein